MSVAVVSNFLPQNGCLVDWSFVGYRMENDLKNHSAGLCFVGDMVLYARVELLMPRCEVGSVAYFLMNVFSQGIAHVHCFENSFVLFASK